MKIGLWLVVVVVSCDGSVASNGTWNRTTGQLLPEERLMADLLSDYDLNAAPFSEDGTPFNVTVVPSVSQILDVNEPDQLIVIFFQFIFRWKDPRLRWKPSDYAGINRTVIFTDKLWFPDFRIQNTFTSPYKQEHHKYYRSIVTSAGVVSWSTQGVYKIMCGVDITFFPFDDQLCSIVLGNWAFSSRDIIPILDEEQLKRKHPTNTIWNVINITSDLQIEDYSCCSNSFYTIYLNIYMSRKSRFYWVNLLAPCVILNVLMHLVFLLPHESGEKTSSGISIFLALSVFQLIITESIPRTSDTVPVIGKYILLITSQAALTTILSMLSLRIYYRDPKHSPSRACCLLLRYFDKDIQSREHLSPSSGTHIGEDNKDLVQEQQCVETKAGVAYHNLWQKIAFLLDVLCFVVCLLFNVIVTVYFLYLLPLEKPHIDDLVVKYKAY